MTRKELKAHCLKQIENCEVWAKCKGEEPHGKIYEEHKLILELLEQEPFINKPCIAHGVCHEDKVKVLDKIRDEIKQEIIPRNSDQYDHETMWQNMGLRIALKVIDKYKAENEKKE